MAMRKPVKKAAPKKSMPKKGDEPVRAGRAPAKPRNKMDNYKKAYKDLQPFGILDRTQYNYDYGGPEMVAEKRDASGFGKTKSSYKNSDGTYTLPKTTDFVMRQAALRDKAAKAKAKAKKKK